LADVTAGNDDDIRNLRSGDTRLGLGRLPLPHRPAKDLIIRGGHDIDPRLVEGAPLSHPAVTGARAVGQPDRRAGEVPIAHVTLSDVTVGRAIFSPGPPGR
jgi:acyl-CoA synthetase (AMP-forming)/AMP-acid ligase II